MAFVTDAVMRDENSAEAKLHGIIGESAVIRQTLAGARKAALSEATVLIVGEPGSGKELFARAIHRLSARRNHSFVKVNCAAKPGQLETLLFGREDKTPNGVSEKRSSLELANRGILFLEEVGDLPPELQPKLLRVLQDHEFERPLGTRILRLDVRVIATTKNSLAKRVVDGRFHSDLFYRLNVFPIHVPPLRQRREDIPLLVRHFVQEFALRMNKQIETIPEETMNALMKRDWPANVRELETLVERLVASTQGSTLQALPETAPKKPTRKTED